MSDCIEARPGVGVELHVEGNGAETIVMVHGWPDTYRLWDRQVEALRARYRCVRFTLPGFDDPGARHVYSLDELSGLLRRIVEHVSPNRPVTLLLHDWGCVFGYEFCMRHPQLVARVIGVDVGDPQSLQRAAAPREKLMALSYQMALALAWKIGGPAGDRLTRSTARAVRCRTPPAQIHAWMNWPYPGFWFGARKYRTALQAFRPACPTLFIFGRRKPVMFHAPDWAQELAQREGNQVEGFDTSHWVMVEQPERFNQVVGDWLSRTADPAPAAPK
jgi:pimeloyl-ACP methyl ester carboxylesterase